MTKEKIIMEISTKSAQLEAVEVCIAALKSWLEMEDLIPPLRSRRESLQKEIDLLLDESVGGKFDIEKVFSAGKED